MTDDFLLAQGRTSLELHKTYNLRYFNRKVLNDSGETPVKEVSRVPGYNPVRGIRRDDIGKGIDVYA